VICRCRLVAALPLEGSRYLDVSRRVPAVDDEDALPRVVDADALPAIGQEGGLQAAKLGALGVRRAVAVVGIADGGVVVRPGGEDHHRGLTRVRRSSAVSRRASRVTLRPARATRSCPRRTPPTW
jgi:hypothetical protein